MIIARNRCGWSVRISSGITLQGISPMMTFAPVTGLRALDAFAAVGFFAPVVSPLLAFASDNSGTNALLVPAHPKIPVSTHTRRCR